MSKRNVWALCLIFIFNPVIGLALSGLYGINSRSKNHCIPFLILCSLYIAAINSTKIPESDELAYIEMFANVPRNGLWGTMQFLTDGVTTDIKEFLYGLLVYILYYLTFGHEFLFIAIISFLIYVIEFSAFYKICDSSISNFQLIAGICILLFFPQFFNLSAQIIRQLLATSIFLYALSVREKSLKMFYVISICSFFIHNSIGLILILSYIPFLHRRISIKIMAVLILIILYIVTMIPEIALSLLELNAFGGVNVALSKASMGEEISDGGEVNMIIILIITLPLLIISALDALVKKNVMPSIITNLCMIWCLIVLSLSSMPVIQYRFFFVLYSFFPFILIIPFQSRKRFSVISCSFLSVFMLVMFCSSYNGGPYVYASWMKAVFYPYPFLLNY